MIMKPVRISAKATVINSPQKNNSRHRNTYYYD